MQPGAVLIRDTNLMPQRDYPWSAISRIGICLWTVAATGSLLLAYEVPVLTSAILVYSFAVVQLTRAPSLAAAFLSGLTVGYIALAVELWFLFGMFGPFALLLFLIGAAWTGLFVALGRETLLAFGARAAIGLLPMLWIALEYVRSELYWLRFSWLIPGHVFAGNGRPVLVDHTGVYGAGFLLMLVSVCAWQFQRRWAVMIGATVMVAFAGYIELASIVVVPAGRQDRDANTPVIAGVQLEFSSTERVVAALDRVVAEHADVDIAVLSEYTFSSPPPEAVRAWCRRNGRFLVVGGTSPVAGDASNFQNTAFVIGPDGEIVFLQAKSVPIPFFRDGEPAATQQLWESPWGKIGICICYDLSFSRVTDELIRQGAELLIVPTMDVTHWGKRQHELHAMIAPNRAAENGVPIVRVCSSGISQVVDSRGQVTESLPFPGQAEMFAARVRLSSGARVPPDRLLAWFGIAVSAMVVVVLAAREYRLHSTKNAFRRFRT
jgi:apolipoprotein N-acyltransferase